MLDACNGLLPVDGLAGQHLALEVHDHLALNGAGQRWEVDAARLLAAVASLPQHELEHLERWACTFWRDEARDLDAYVAGLLLPLPTRAHELVQRAQQGGGSLGTDAHDAASAAAVQALLAHRLAAVAEVPGDTRGRYMITLTARGRVLAV